MIRLTMSKKTYEISKSDFKPSTLLKLENSYHYYKIDKKGLELVMETKDLTRRTLVYL